MNLPAVVRGPYNVRRMFERTPQSISARPDRWRRAWLVWLGIFVVFGLLYVWTAQRGPAWQDSGTFQWRILSFDLYGHLGLALSHPLLILLGKPFSFLPAGALAWRMNLVSALAGAVAAANIGLLVWRLSGGRWLGSVFAAATFGLAHTPWWLATICEAQAVNVAIFTAQLHVLTSLLRKPSVKLAALLGLLSGLGLMAHNLSLLALPAYGVAVLYCCRKRGLSWAAVVGMIGGYLIGSSVFLAMIVSQAIQIGPVEAIQSALFGNRWRSDVFGGSRRALLMGGGYIVYNFPNLALPLLAAGAWVMHRRLARPLWMALVYLFGVYFLFAIRYTVPDQFMFFLPLYALVAVGAGIGLVYVSRLERARWLAWVAVLAMAVTPVIYAVTPAAWTKASLPLPGREDLPRDPARYWLTPWKHNEDSAGLFATAALMEVPPGSTIIADGTSLYPLLLVQQTDNLGESVALLRTAEATPATVPPGTRNVFVVSDLRRYFPVWMEGRADFRKYSERQMVFHVAWRRNSSRPTGG